LFVCLCSGLHRKFSSKFHENLIGLWITLKGKPLNFGVDPTENDQMAGILDFRY